MISIFLFFKSPKMEWNYLIPWRSTSKKGFNPQTPIQDKLIDLIALLVDRFLLPVKSLKNPRPLSQIYTTKFVNKTIDEKLDFVKKLGKDRQNKGFLSAYDYEDERQFEEYFNEIKESLDPLLYLEEYYPTKTLYYRSTR